MVTALTLLGTLTPFSASGSTIDDKKQEAAQLGQEIQSNGDRIAALGEAYNGAVLEYQNAQSGVAERETALRGRGGATTRAERSRRRSRRGALSGRAGPLVAVAQHEHPVGERVGCANAIRSGRDRQRRVTHLEPRARESKTCRSSASDSTSRWRPRSRSATTSRRRRSRSSRPTRTRRNCCHR